MTSISPSTLDDFDQFERQRDLRPLTEKADPLALSWVAYHVWRRSPRSRWVPWNDLEVSEHDREIAMVTRRYYRDKLAMQALRANHDLSPFSLELYDICNGGIMRECHRGMLYRLPYFYVEDTKRDTLHEHTLQQPDLRQVPAFLAEKSPRLLQKHSRIFRTRRSQEIMEFWFHDSETGHAVQWPVAYDNPLLSLVQQYWDTNNLARINALWRIGHDRRRDFSYWVIKDPEFVF